MGYSKLHRLRLLGGENCKPKQLVSDLSLNKHILQVVSYVAALSNAQLRIPRSHGEISKGAKSLKP